MRGMERYQPGQRRFGEQLAEHRLEVDEATRDRGDQDDVAIARRRDRGQAELREAGGAERTGRRGRKDVRREERAGDVDYHEPVGDREQRRDVEIQQDRVVHPVHGDATGREHVPCDDRDRLVLDRRPEMEIGAETRAEYRPDDQHRQRRQQTRLHQTMLRQDADAVRERPRFAAQSRKIFSPPGPRSNRTEA